LPITRRSPAIDRHAAGRGQVVEHQCDAGCGGQAGGRLKNASGHQTWGIRVRRRVGGAQLPGIAKSDAVNSSGHGLFTRA
jgi:hypothetical protein